MTSTDPRQHLLEECLPFIERMARKFAPYAPAILDVDDLYQEGCAGVLKACAHIPADSPAPGRYLVACARYAIIDAIREQRSAVRVPESSQRVGVRPPIVESLDAPLMAAECFTLQDVIAAPEASAPTTRLSRAQLRAIRAAVSRLPVKQRTTVCLRYGLPTLAKRYPVGYNVERSQSNAIQQLRHDEALRQEVQA